MVFLTASVRKRVPVFGDHSLAAGFLELLGEMSRHFHVVPAAFVLMPDHLHGLLGLPSYALLPKFVQTLKSLSARRLRTQLESSFVLALTDGSVFRLWRRRYDDLIVTTREQFEIKLNYIHRNPVRAGLAAKAEDYPFSSVRYWLNGEMPEVPITDEAAKYIPL